MTNLGQGIISYQKRRKKEREKERKGKERKGKERKGKERKGKERKRKKEKDGLCGSFPPTLNPYTRPSLPSLSEIPTGSEPSCWVRASDPIAHVSSVRVGAVFIPASPEESLS